jgi:hypothetical protein
MAKRKTTMAKRKTTEDAPLPRLVLPELRSWKITWYDPTKKKLVEEIATGHQLSYPQPNMMLVHEFEIQEDGEIARALVRKVIVSTFMTFDECTTPTFSGSSEVM